jgi:hypothetical protein
VWLITDTYGDLSWLTDAWAWIWSAYEFLLGIETRWHGMLLCLFDEDLMDQRKPIDLYPPQHL